MGRIPRGKRNPRQREERAPSLGDLASCAEPPDRRPCGLAGAASGSGPQTGDPSGLGPGSYRPPLSISPCLGPFHSPLEDFCRSTSTLSTPGELTLSRSRQVSLFKDLVALWLGGFVNPASGVGAAHGGVTSGSRAVHLADHTPQIHPRRAAVIEILPVPPTVLPSLCISICIISALLFQESSLTVPFA